MATGLTQRASHHGSRFSQSSFEARGSDTDRGSPLAMFRRVASGIAVLAVTSSAIGAVAHLAHLINTSWRIF